MLGNRLIVDLLESRLQTGSEVISVLSSMVSIICLEKMKSPKHIFAGKTFKQVVCHLELELGPLEALDATKELIQLVCKGKGKQKKKNQRGKG